MIAILWRLLLIKIGWADRQHRRCLQRIAALERALWPPTISFEPGVVWPVEATSYIQVYRGIDDTTLYRAGASNLVTSAYLAKRNAEQQAFYPG